MEELELQKSSADAAGFDEYKAIREGAKIPAETPVLVEIEVEEPSVAAPAAETITEKPEAQIEEIILEIKEPTPEPVKRDRSAKGRARELFAEGRFDEAEKILSEAAAKAHRDKTDKLEQELQQYRTRKPEAEPIKEVAKPVAIDPNDPKPVSTDAKYQGENGFEEYLEAKVRWGIRQEQKAEKAETQKQQAERKDIEERQLLAKKLEAARATYDDFDDAGVGNLILSDSMLSFAKKHPEGVDVLYRLGKDREEFSRIYALEADMQAAELGGIAREIRIERQRANTPPPVVPAVPALEKPKPAAPVSKIPPVEKRASGTEVGSKPDARNASNFDDYKKARPRT